MSNADGAIAHLNNEQRIVSPPYDHKLSICTHNWNNGCSAGSKDRDYQANVKTWIQILYMTVERDTLSLSLLASAWDNVPINIRLCNELFACPSKTMCLMFVIEHSQRSSCAVAMAAATLPQPFMVTKNQLVCLFVKYVLHCTDSTETIDHRTYAE